jgi:hypothetical protein
MMKSTQAFSQSLLFWAFSACLVTSLAVSPTARAADAAAIPLPAEMAKDLELLGKGVVGKALPAPPLTDIHEYLNLGAGTWEYKIVAGGKDGKEVRSEVYEKLPEKKGDAEVWKRSIGTEFVEYVTIQSNHEFGKHLEDDLDVGYSSRFKPGVLWLGKTEAGKTRTIESKIESFKTDKPDHVSYHGKLSAKISYVGQYEVTTPAGTFPALLMRSEFDIKVGPAKVTDTSYTFYAKGVGKVAELESTFVSALLVYHSDTKVAKLLTKYPKR